ncbi:MAG: site-specific integrase [Frankia sp.]|nr:site-specific integrase [Frankia sp.]
MGSLRKLDTGRWQARYRDPARRERSQSFETKREAERFLASVTVQLARTEWVDPAYAQLPLRRWAEVWVAARVVEPTTALRDEATIRNHLLAHFGDYALGAITRMSVQSWVAKLRDEGLAPSSIAKCYHLLTAMMTAAVDEGLLRVTPCRKISLPRRAQHEQVFLSAPQVRAVLHETPERYQAFVMTAYTTGCRWSELAGLRVRHLDLLRRKLDVVEVLREASGQYSFGPPKSRASRRSISLPRQTVDALAAHLAKYPPVDGLVFTGGQGALLSRGRFRQRVWAPAVTRAKLDPRPRFHDLRHSHAAALIADGAPLKAVQQRLGHGSIRVTFDVYGHLLPEVDEAMLAGLERRIAGFDLGPQQALPGT